MWKNVNLTANARIWYDYYAVLFFLKHKRELFSVIARRKAEIAFENLGEIVIVGDSDLNANLIDFVIIVCQKLFCLFHAQTENIVADCDVKVFFPERIKAVF